MRKSPAHVIGFDDAPFPRRHRGDVRVIGAVFAGTRLEGVLSTRVRRDGANATDRLLACLRGSRFGTHVQAVLLQGVALAGFNVVDVPRLSRELGVPVLVIARRAPDYPAIREALLARVPGGRRKWRLIERLGPMEPMAGVYIQRVGIDPAAAEALIRRLAINSHLPEPIRTAHLIAGGIGTGESRHRA